MRLTPAMWRLLPPISIAGFALVVAAVLASAGRTLGFDFLAYHSAADRVLHGQPAYDTSFRGAGGFGLFYYPPTFIPLVLPFGLLGATTATWLWIGLSIAAFAIGVVVLPVASRTKWLIVLLAGEHGRQHGQDREDAEPDDERPRPPRQQRPDEHEGGLDLDRRPEPAAHPEHRWRRDARPARREQGEQDRTDLPQLQRVQERPGQPGE